MQTKKEKNKSWLAITGFLLLFLGISAITYYVASNKNLDNQEQNALKDFYILIFKDQEQDVFRMHVNNYENNLTVLKSEAPFNNGVYGLMVIVESFLKTGMAKEKTL